MMKLYRILICGGRGFTNYDLLKERCDHFIKNLNKDDIEIVTGDAMGADALARDWAKESELLLHDEFIADWNKHGLSAGPIRNKQMAEYSTHCIAFWDGESTGTFDMLRAANKAKLKIKIVRYEKSVKKISKGPYAREGDHG